MLSVEIRIGGHYGIKAGRNGRSALRYILPAFRGWCSGFGRTRRRVGAALRQGHDLLTGRAAHRVPRRIRIVGWPLAAGTLAQDTAQSQENEHCEGEENDGVDVEHFGHSFAIATSGQ